MAENALAVLEVTPEQLALVKNTVAFGATAEELQLYLYDCKRQGVHPLDKMIYFTKRGKTGKYTPVTSIDFMRTRAADSGEYAGSDDPVFVGEPAGAGFQATATVWRMVQGTRCPFVATARWSEYKPDKGQSGVADAMWLRMPHSQLGKCAEALALRKAFPKQTAKMYEFAEMDQAGEPQNAAAPVPERRLLAPARAQEVPALPQSPAVDPAIVAALKGHEVAANAYLQKNKVIRVGQSYVDATPDVWAEILKDVPKFLDAIAPAKPAAQRSTVLMEKLAGHENDAFAWLRAKKWVQASLAELTPNQIETILSNTPAFIEAITKAAAAPTPAAPSVTPPPANVLPPVDPNLAGNIELLAVILKGHEAEANQWMVAKGWLKPGEPLTSVLPKNVAAVCAKPDAFLRAIAAK